MDRLSYRSDGDVIWAIEIEENEIFLIGRKDRQPERRGAIVPDRNPRLHRFTAADQIDARRVQANDIAQGRRGQSAMRVARQKRLTAWGPRACNRPGIR